MASRAERGGRAEWEIPSLDRDKMQRRRRLTKGRRNAPSDPTLQPLAGAYILKLAPPPLTFYQPFRRSCLLLARTITLPENMILFTENFSVVFTNSYL